MVSDSLPPDRSIGAIIRTKMGRVVKSRRPASFDEEAMAEDMLLSDRSKQQHKRGGAGTSFASFIPRSNAEATDQPAPTPVPPHPNHGAFDVNEGDEQP